MQDQHLFMEPLLNHTDTSSLSSFPFLKLILPYWVSY